MAGSGDRPNRLETASCRAMKRPTRVQVYEGMYRSQADELFQADAAEAARHGWRAVDEGRWNGEQLAVTYVHEPGWKGGLRRKPEPPKPTSSSTPAQPSPSRARRLASAFVHTTVLLALLAAVVVAIIGVALIADVGNIREMAEDLPKPIPRLVKDNLEWVKSVRG
jgi:hypothetical protein